MTKQEQKQLVKEARNTKDYIILDIETTGFSPSKGGFLLEIGALKVVNDEIVDTFSELINPINKKIPRKIVELTGITDEMVKDEKDYKKVLRDFLEFIKDTDVIIGHNVSFDWDRFLLYYFEKIALFPKKYTLDTKKLFKIAYGSKKGKLSDITDLLGIDNMGQHRAINDCESTYEVFLSIKKKLKDTIVVEEQINIFDMNNKVDDDFQFAKLEKFKYDDFTIRGINYWGKKDMERLYVMLNLKGVTNHQSIYFDIKTKSWGNKDVKDKNIDIKKVEERLLQSKFFINKLKKDRISKDDLETWFNQKVKFKEIKKVKKITEDEYQEELIEMIKARGNNTDYLPF